MCKHCNKLRQRDWVNSAAPSRQKLETVELTPEQKQESYTAALLRMRTLGIMSEKTFQEALNRVQNDL